VIREHCLGHPPLNPLPSRAGKQEKTSPSREGNEKGESDTTRILPL
jgi:hypothetical protein